MNEGLLFVRKTLRFSDNCAAATPVYQHIYPTFGKPHVIAGTSCWCNPQPDPINPAVLFHQPDN